MAFTRLAVLVTLTLASLVDNHQQSANDYTLNLTVDELQTDFQAFKNKLIGRKKGTDYVRDRKTQLKENIRKRPKAGVKVSNSTLSTSQAALHALEMKIETLAAKIDKNEKDLNSTLQAALRSLEMKIKTLEAKMEKENATANKYALKSTVESDLQAMNTTIGAIKSTLGIIQETMKTMESNIGTTVTNESFVALQSTVDAHRGEINAIETMIGRVVYFRATFKLDYFWTPPKVAVFDIELENTGKAYSPLTGIFKAPFQGLYVFTVQLVTPGGQDIKLDLRVNSISVMLSRAISIKEASTVFVYLTSLQAGDEVYVYHKVACDIFGRMSSFFSGWLVKSY